MYATLFCLGLMKGAHVPQLLYQISDDVLDIILVNIFENILIGGRKHFCTWFVQKLQHAQKIDTLWHTKSPFSILSSESISLMTFTLNVHVGTN